MKVCYRGATSIRGGDIAWTVEVAKLSVSCKSVPAAELSAHQLLAGLKIYGWPMATSCLGDFIPGEGLCADPVDSAGEKAVGNRCIPRLFKIHRNDKKWTNWVACLDSPGWLIDSASCSTRGEHYLSSIQSKDCQVQNVSNKSKNCCQKTIILFFVDILNSAFHTSSSFEDADVRSRYSLPAYHRLCWTHDALCFPKQRKKMLFSSFLFDISTFAFYFVV